MSSRASTRLAVVVPCFQVERHVASVIDGLPDWVAVIVAVDDGSTDGTGRILDRLAEREPRLRVVHHPANRGVGAAMVTGFRLALELGAEVVVKMDGDGQMSADHLADLVRPLLEGRADYAKGNRFRHTRQLTSMPAVRMLGNVALTFMTKSASGCWHLFDVQNGYVAITREALNALPLDKAERGYCFENWMLVELSIQDFRIADVAMPARYGDERSAMRILQVMLVFPPKLLRLFLRRLFLKYVVFDVSPIAIYVATGTALFLFSAIFGGYYWAMSSTTGIPTYAGRVALAMLPMLMSFSLFLQAVDLDIRNSPRPRETGERLDLDEVVARLGRGAAAGTGSGQTVPD